jgi:lysophospholipid acyltransferase (LPLAT)-like uncharacterized protein
VSPQDKFTLAQRLQFTLGSAIAVFLIRLIGSTLRWQISIEDGGPERPLVQPSVYAFWHQCILPATWWFRNSGVGVISSRSRDGEFTTRVIQRLGYRSIRGSSSSGGARALLEAHDCIAQGHTVGFTIDGPRGPRFIAKPGAVLLAANTGMPIVCFHISLERAWILRSWDELRIPKPFSRAVMRVSGVMRVAEPRDEAARSRAHEELQQSLERVREWAEARAKEFTTEDTGSHREE